ncbi:hypothetical protein [Streptomyces virginiae]|uniref:hypothetical protein n=1 Tax=Streptomyces virginiae TaxID=1961 RepID=UPI0022535ECE|nr:hypothetical protein [Streptomyces virginiae]MCX5278089.1 hypothetical protein [Streptomyces virginiae]
MNSVQAPAVALREGRFPDHPTIVVTGTGVHYEGGHRDDQVDPDFQVLRERWGGPGDGLPLYGEFDPDVQWEAADRLLCAYCLNRPDRAPGEGLLWLLRTDVDQHRWPADIETTTPPICDPHARLALKRCATLRRGYLAVRVREVEPVGVLGTVFTGGGPNGPDELVRFTETDRLPYVLARYLVLELRGAEPDPALHPDLLVETP